MKRIAITAGSVFSAMSLRLIHPILEASQPACGVALGLR
jgi:hypothetical protein